MLTAEQKRKTVETYRRNQDEKDSGSPEVQIALLTQRIQNLSQHLQTHRHDFHSRVGLMKLVGQRRRLLRYLARTNPQSYQRLVAALNIRA